MNTQQRGILLQKFKQNLLKHKNSLQIHSQIVNIKNIPLKTQEKLDKKIMQELIINQQQISLQISSTHQKISNILEQINLLKIKKDNIQKFMDCMTSIQQLKKLSYGIGDRDDPQQIYRNLVNYYSIKHKTYYCQNYIATIEQQIQQISISYKNKFSQELVKQNQQTSISIISKILTLISKNTQKNVQLNNSQNIYQFYKNIIDKQLKNIEEELFKIPIIGNTIQSIYLFFDLAKDSMKIFVTTITNYRNNIVRVIGLEGLHQIIIKLFKYILNTIILEILRRQKKYFEIDKIDIDAKKLTIKDKDYFRLTHYFNQFNAIWNQIQRLRYHLQDQLRQDQYPIKRQQYINELRNSINSIQFVEFNSNIINYMHAYQRHHLDRLLKKSPFISSLWQLDINFFKQFQQNPNNIELYMNCEEGNDFLEKITDGFHKGIQKSFETLNILIVSAIVNFTNHNLLGQDTFYAFNQLFNRNINKLPNTDYNLMSFTKSKSIPNAQIAIILLINVLSHLPNVLKIFLQMKIPQQLPKERIRGQIYQLVHSNSTKAQQTILAFLDRLVSTQWFKQQINLDFRKVTQKWQYFQRTVYQIFINKVSNLHSEILLTKNFGINSLNKKFDQNSLINLEKNVRQMIAYYDSKSTIPNTKNFKTILTYIELLLCQDQNQASRIIETLRQQYDCQELRRVWGLKSK